MPVVTRADSAPRIVVVSRARTAATISGSTTAVQVPARQPQTGTVVQQTKVVEVSAGGPQGKQGDPGPAGGATATGIVGTSLSALRVLYQLGDALYAADPSDGMQVGLVVGLGLTAAASAGQAVIYQATGNVDDASWSWDIGPVFLGPAGTLTQAAPTNGWELVVGWASSPTRINLTFDEPVQL